MHTHDHTVWTAPPAHSTVSAWTRATLDCSCTPTTTLCGQHHLHNCRQLVANHSGRALQNHIAACSAQYTKVSTRRYPLYARFLLTKTRSWHLPNRRRCKNVAASSCHEVFADRDTHPCPPPFCTSNAFLHKCLAHVLPRSVVHAFRVLTPLDLQPRRQCFVAQPLLKVETKRRCFVTLPLHKLDFLAVCHAPSKRALTTYLQTPRSLRRFVPRTFPAGESQHPLNAPLSTTDNYVRVALANILPTLRSLQQTLTCVSPTQAVSIPGLHCVSGVRRGC